MNAAEVLAAHLPVEDGFGCAGCGWLPKSMASTDDDEFGEHQFDALKAAGYAVVKIPAMQPDKRGLFDVSGSGIQVSYRGDEFSLWVWNSVRGSTLQKRFDASVGYDLAATILAAEAQS